VTPYDIVKKVSQILKLLKIKEIIWVTREYPKYHLGYWVVSKINSLYINYLGYLGYRFIYS